MITSSGYFLTYQHTFEQNNGCQKINILFLLENHLNRLGRVMNKMNVVNTKKQYFACDRCYLLPVTGVVNCHLNEAF